MVAFWRSVHCTVYVLFQGLLLGCARVIVIWHDDHGQEHHQQSPAYGRSVSQAPTSVHAVWANDILILYMHHIMHPLLLRRAVTLKTICFNWSVMKRFFTIKFMISVFSLLEWIVPCFHVAAVISKTFLDFMKLCELQVIFTEGHPVELYGF